MFHIESHTTGADLIDSNSGELVYRLEGGGALEVAHQVASDQSPGVRVSWSSLPMLFNPARHFTADYRCGYFAGLEVPA